VENCSCTLFGLADTVVVVVAAATPGLVDIAVERNISAEHVDTAGRLQVVAVAFREVLQPTS
jgi:hypothetical protein